MTVREAQTVRIVRLQTPSHLNADATQDICAAMTALLANVFAIHVKTKNLHRHASGPRLRNYHFMLDDPLPSLTNPIAELRDDNSADVPTTSLLETWIDGTEQRTWFLFEAGRDDSRAGA